jgi:isopentenyldiphosphate isomerase
VLNAFLVNDYGQIWIPRRSSLKRIFPLCLDMSVGGHVVSGESYEEAFRRELLVQLDNGKKCKDLPELLKIFYIN